MATTPAASLAEKMVVALEAQRQNGGAAYPVSLHRLVELADAQASPDLVKKAIVTKTFKDRVVVALKSNPAAPVAFVEDVDRLAASPVLLELVLERLCTSASPTCIVAKVTGQVDRKLKKPLAAVLDRQTRDNALPSPIGSQLEKNKPVLFLRRIPPPPPPPPPRKPDEVLAEKLLQVLEAQRRLGGDAYPLTLKRLVELTQPGTDDRSTKKALAHPSVNGKLLRVDLTTKGSVVAFAEDRVQMLGSRVLLEFLLRTKRADKNHAVVLDRLLPPKSEWREPVLAAINRQIETSSLPVTIGWMWISKKRYVFLMEDVHCNKPQVAPAQPTAAADFGKSFDAAFRQLDQHNGSSNFICLLPLRKMLPFSREVFDAELRKLRIAGRYTLSAAEGRHGLSAEELAAGILEDGSLLLYVSRKLP